VAGFSLREVARRAGVSHAAPAHHFGDATGLLTSLAVEAFRLLVAETEAAVAGVEDPEDALAAVGRAYVTVAAEHPGHCAIVFRNDAVDVADPLYQEWGDRAYGVLVTTVARLAAERAPDLDVSLAAQLCWSSVQGLVGLYGTMEGLAAKDGRSLPPIGAVAESFTRLLVRGLVGHDATV